LCFPPGLLHRRARATAAATAVAAAPARAAASVTSAADAEDARPRNVRAAGAEQTVTLQAQHNLINLFEGRRNTIIKDVVLMFLFFVSSNITVTKLEQ
jgi:3-oxoacyl-ACP reductase-like protein